MLAWVLGLVAVSISVGYVVGRWWAVVLPSALIAAWFITALVAYDPETTNQETVLYALPGYIIGVVLAAICAAVGVAMRRERARRRVRSRA